MDKKFYTYIYLDPRKRGFYCYENVCFLYEPIYVGKGKDKRYLDHLKTLKNKRNNPFKNKLLKILKSEFVLFDIRNYILIFNNLLEMDAFNLEKKLIQEIGRKDLKLGPLANLTNGGEGLSNPSVETRIKISKAQKGKNVSEKTKKQIADSLKGRKCSAETKQKLVIALKGKRIGEKNPMFGKHLSQETKKRISEKLNGEKNPMFGKGFIMVGKHHSAESIEKISRSKMGEKHPMFGKHHSKETRRKQSIAHPSQKSPLAKLTEKQVHQIHMLLRLNFQREDIAQKYNVSFNTISSIKKGRSWKNIFHVFNLEI